MAGQVDSERWNREQPKSMRNSKEVKSSGRDAINLISVLHVDSVGHAGMHSLLQSLCSQLATLSMDVGLATTDYYKYLDPDDAFRILRPFKGIYGDKPFWTKGLNYFRALYRVASCVMRYDYQIVHFHFFIVPVLDLLLLRYLRLRKRRVVITVHDVLPYNYKAHHKPIFRRIYGLADRIIVHADVSRRELVESFAIDPARISQFPLGNFSMFAPVPLRRELAKRKLGIDPEKSVVLFFGTIKREKGLQYLIKAFAKVRERCPSSVLVIAGRVWKHDFSTYDNLIRQLHLGDNIIRCIHYISEEKLGFYFSAADVVALPYTRLYQSAVLRHAYLYSRPVVASKIGAMSIEVKDGETGYLVPPKNVSLLAEAICKVLEDEQRAIQMGNMARIFADQEFSWDAIALKTKKTYMNLLTTSLD